MKAALFAILATTVHAEEAVMQLHPSWEFVADTVMGGVSTGTIAHETVQGRDAMRLTGQVSLDNDGGFVQMASDLREDGGAMDASDWTGIALDVLGNDEIYELRVRTDQLSHPWQSFRAEFTASGDWTTVSIPFADLKPHKTDASFDPAHVRRIGIVAIGREFAADVAVASIRFYR